MAISEVFKGRCVCWGGEVSAVVFVGMDTEHGCVVGQWYSSGLPL